MGRLPGFLAGIKRVFNNSTQKAEVEDCWDFQTTSLFCVARPCPRERKEGKRKELDICLVCGVPSSLRLSEVVTPVVKNKTTSAILEELLGVEIEMGKPMRLACSLTKAVSMRMTGQCG